MPFGIVEMERIVFADGGRAGLADGAHEFAGGGEDFHLMAAAAIADEDAAVVRPARVCCGSSRRCANEDFRRRELHRLAHGGERVAMQSRAGEHEQAAFGIEREAARILQRDFGDDVFLCDIEEDELIELHHAEDEHAVAHGDAAEVLSPGVFVEFRRDRRSSEKVYLMIGLLPCAVMVVSAVMRISPFLSFAFFGAESSPQAAPA